MCVTHLIRFEASNAFVLVRITFAGQLSVPVKLDFSAESQQESFNILLNQVLYQQAAQAGKEIQKNQVKSPSSNCLTQRRQGDRTNNTRHTTPGGMEMWA